MTTDSIFMRPLDRLIRPLFLCLLIATSPADAQEGGYHDELLARLAGSWIMTGTIAGERVTHDVTVEWVLNHQYLRMYEISREKDSTGGPAYEAIVFFGQDITTGGYACVWLDITGGTGLTGPLGRAMRQGNSMPFVFDDGSGSVILNTFTYTETTDTWESEIDLEANGERREFARVVFRRKE